MQKHSFMRNAFRLGYGVCITAWLCSFLALGWAEVAYEAGQEVNNAQENFQETTQPTAPVSPCVGSAEGELAGLAAQGHEEAGDGAAVDVTTAGGNTLSNVVYESVVVAKKGVEMLALYNTLSDPVDKESLDALARHCYQQMSGNLYKKVLVNWYLPGQSKGDKPWAVSNFADGQEVIEILDEELVKKFPSVKRWQQPGHDPLPR